MRELYLTLSGKLKVKRDDVRWRGVGRSMLPAKGPLAGPRRCNRGSSCLSILVPVISSCIEFVRSFSEL